MEGKEYIKVRVINNDLELQEKADESIIVRGKEIIENAQSFFENEFKDLVCEKCNEKSKGNVVFEVNTETDSGSLYCNDFCCTDFENKTKGVLK